MSPQSVRLFLRLPHDFFSSFDSYRDSTIGNVFVFEEEEEEERSTHTRINIINMRLTRVRANTGASLCIAQHEKAAKERASRPRRG
jgi:hypothetical protein